MRGFSSRHRFLAAFGWCRNDMGEPPPVGITYFRTNDKYVTKAKRVMSAEIGR